MNNQPTEKQIPVARLVRVIAWVEIMGKRAETTFDVQSPWVCDGACPELQKQTDQAVANWVFHSLAKSGFTVSQAPTEKSQKTA